MTLQDMKITPLPPIIQNRETSFHIILSSFNSFYATSKHLRKIQFRYTIWVPISTIISFNHCNNNHYHHNHKTHNNHHHNYICKGQTQMQTDVVLQCLYSDWNLFQNYKHKFTCNITGKPMIMQKTHISCVLLDFMFICMRTRDATTPEAVLTQLVAVTLLAFVAKTWESFPLTCVTGHRMNNWTRKRYCHNLGFT
jgi:hypothetical protein